MLLFCRSVDVVVVIGAVIGAVIVVVVVVTGCVSVVSSRWSSGRRC